MESGTPITTHRIRGLRVDLQYSVEDHLGKVSSITENRLKQSKFMAWVKDRQGQLHRFILDNTFEAENLDPEMLVAILEVIGQEHLGLLKEEPKQDAVVESHQNAREETKRED